MERKGISAKMAVQQMAEKWESKGERPVTDDSLEMTKRERLGILKPKMKESLNKVGTNAWRKLRLCLDSGAGEIVMAEDDLPEIETAESLGSKHGQSYEVANGSEIDNEEEKKFIRMLENPA